jgi:hypothetical protein
MPVPPPSPYDAGPVESDAESPDVLEVLQYDGEGVPTVPVRLTNKVRVEQLPTRMGAMMSVNVSATEPEMLLPRNPKRSTITLVAIGIAFFIAWSKERCMRDESRFIVANTTGVVMKFHWTDELWVMKTGAGAAGDRLSIATEDWVL